MFFCVFKYKNLSIGVLIKISLYYHKSSKKKNKNLEWFPRMRAMSLDSSEKDEEDNEINHLKQKFELTNNLVINLSKQLEELKESVI